MESTLNKTNLIPILKSLLSGEGETIPKEESY